MVALVSFLLGGAVIGYGVWYFTSSPPSSQKTFRAVEPVIAADDGGDDTALAVTATPTPAIPSSALPTPVRSVENAVETVDRVAEQAGGLAQRLEAAEMRLARLDEQAQIASGNAARAEGTLIIIAIRRALERGSAIGPLEEQLRLRFEQDWREEVRTIIDFSRKPVKLDQLSARLEGLASDITATNQAPSWEGFKREIASLLVIRRESTPSPQPEKRLERARMFLETGRVTPAVEEIRLMPGAQAAARWIDDAERLAEAMEALETLEAAVLDSDKVRDGEGRLIERGDPQKPE